MTEIYQNKPEDPRIDITMHFTVDQVKQLFTAIGHYNWYRVNDREEETKPLAMSHPLMQIQALIANMLDPLIQEGMKQGHYVAPLIDLKQLLTDAVEGEGEVQI